MKLKNRKTPPDPSPTAATSGLGGLRWLEKEIAPLAASCPWTKTNPAECPLSGVRELAPADVAKWLAALSPQEREYLVLYHQCCLAIRWENEMEAVQETATGSRSRR